MTKSEYKKREKIHSIVLDYDEKDKNRYQRVFITYGDIILEQVKLTIMRFYNKDEEEYNNLQVNYIDGKISLDLIKRINELLKGVWL